MITEINHIGLAVKSIDDNLKLFANLFGGVEIGRRSFPDLGQTSCLVRIGEATFELMEPFGREGVVPRYLKKNGEGFHHVSLLSDDLAGDCARLRESGIILLRGSGLAVFTHPKTSGGVLYEIVEDPNK